MAEYNRAAEELEAADASLQQVDFACLADYAQSFSDVRRLTKEMRGKEVVSTKQGEVSNPLLRHIMAARQTLRATSAKLGFSPADRARVPKAGASSRADVDSFKDV